MSLHVQPQCDWTPAQVPYVAAPGTPGVLHRVHLLHGNCTNYTCSATHDLLFTGKVHWAVGAIGKACRLGVGIFLLFERRAC